MKIVWSRRAIRHLIASRARIARDSEDAALAIANRIVNAVNLLETQPNLGSPGRLPRTRELVVTGTPYLIPYRVRDERLELLTVFHGRQKWPAKL